MTQPIASGSNGRDNLANNIARDLVRERRATTASIMDCYACGRAFMAEPTTTDDSSRFCTPKCRKAYDDGALRNTNMTDADAWSSTWRVVAGPHPGHMPAPMRAGRHGFLITCGGCGKTFDSKGLRCCSTDCERTYRQREETIATLAEVGMEPVIAKRQCAAGCGGTIPVWRKGRRVSSAVRFCSPRCAARARKSAEGHPPSAAPVFAPETSKKCPFHGPSQPGVKTPPVSP